MPGMAAEVESRALRGLELWSSRRTEMEALGDGDWLVPSESRERVWHRVSLLEETCGCKDSRYSLHRCKHGWAVEYELALLTALAEVAQASGADHCYSAPGGFGRRPS